MVMVAPSHFPMCTIIGDPYSTGLRIPIPRSPAFYFCLFNLIPLIFANLPAWQFLPVIPACS
jgi:hypothetical protein